MSLIIRHIMRFKYTAMDNISKSCLRQEHLLAIIFVIAKLFQFL